MWQTRTPCIGSGESWPLDHQESPKFFTEFFLSVFYFCNFTGSRVHTLQQLWCEGSVVAVTGLYTTGLVSNCGHMGLVAPRHVGSQRHAKECSNCCTIALVSHASKAVLKILQARLQQYVNQELPGVQERFRKGRGNRDQILPISAESQKKQENYRKTSTLLH